MAMTKRNYIKKSEFFEKYKHPNWQKKRLEVMEAANFECQHCGEKNETLNVHHLSYKKGRDPWEYDKAELMCLCEGCHESMHEMEDRLKDALHKYKVMFYGCQHSVEGLIGYVTAKTQLGPFRIKAIDDDEWLAGFLEGYGCDSKMFKEDADYDGETGWFRNLRTLIAADEGFIDHDWLIFYGRDSLFSKEQAKSIANEGFYCPEGFPDWYVNKVSAMVKAWDGPSQSSDGE
jgi:hypothetical protein